MHLKSPFDSRFHARRIWLFMRSTFIRRISRLLILRRMLAMKRRSYDEKYAGEGYFWGKKPSAICDRVIEIVRPSSGFRPRLIDLGCGEGRNAVYFAKHGFDVVGLDISSVGLEKTRRFAAEEGVRVETVQADVASYELGRGYDVVFSTGTLHFLPEKMRAERFKNYKEHTSPSGIDVFSVFVKKPFIPRAPDADVSVFPFLSGELMSYYWDWEIVYCCEEVFDCTSGGVPHKHAVNRIIAKKRA